MEVSQQNLMIKINNRCDLSMVEDYFYKCIHNDLGLSHNINQMSIIESSDVINDGLVQTEEDLLDRVQ